MKKRKKLYLFGCGIAEKEKGKGDSKVRIRMLKNGKRNGGEKSVFPSLLIPRRFVCSFTGAGA
jgi:hypothetical protein